MMAGIGITHENTTALLQKIESLGFKKYRIAIYETEYERENGQPTVHTFPGKELQTAFDFFQGACESNLCAEMRGMDERGKEAALCIGGTARDLAIAGEYLYPAVGPLGFEREQTGTILSLPLANELVDNVLASFDCSNQDLILIGEMSELTSALVNARRGRMEKANVQEELAHVLISLEVYRRVYGITTEEIQSEIAKKFIEYGWQ